MIVYIIFNNNDDVILCNNILKSKFIYPIKVKVKKLIILYKTIITSDIKETFIELLDIKIFIFFTKKPIIRKIIAFKPSVFV